MGLFDTYIPRPPVNCPLCGEEIPDFQGKDGPCGLLTFTQGEEIPFDEFFEEGLWRDYLPRESEEKPDDFELHTFDSNRHWIEARGVVKDGKWVEVIDLKASPLDRQEPSE